MSALWAKAMARSSRVINCVKDSFFGVSGSQGVSSVVGNGDTLPERRKDPDGDLPAYDCFFDLGRFWKTTCERVRGGLLVTQPHGWGA